MDHRDLGRTATQHPQFQPATTPDGPVAGAWQSMPVSVIVGPAQ